MLKKFLPVSLSILFASQAQAFSNSIMDCSRDQRPVDGVLTRYEVIEDSEGTYSLQLTTQFSAWPNGPTEPTSETLMTGMTCTDPDKAGDSPVILVCTSDKTPVDGPLKMLSVTKSKHGKYSIEVRTTIISMRSGKVHESTKTLEKNIACTFSTLK